MRSVSIHSPVLATAEMAAAASARGRILAIAVAATLLSAPPVAADTGDLPRIADELSRLEVRLTNLVKEYGGRDVLSQQRAFDERFADAEILYLLGDYSRASLVLLDLVGDSQAQGNPQYHRAVYYLAESQYQIGNDLAAREYFRALVLRRDRDHLELAIRRLIQLADRLERWEGLDDQVRVLSTRGKLPPSIAYIHAKSLLRRKEANGVAAAVADIDTSHRLWGKGRYLLGVARLLQRDLDGALEIFGELTGLDDRYDDAATMRELAAMNRGRILMEQGKLGPSIDAYQAIDRGSSRFEEALFEITWLFVRAATEADSEAKQREEYTKALKALEILLLSEQATTIAPEARLLLGNVRLRLEKYDEALETFDEVVERYGPVRRELRRLSRNVQDPAAYYDQIAERNRSGTDLLPPLALRWAAEQKHLKKALGVVTDLDQSREWIDESMQILDKLLTVLDSDRRAQLIPALKTAQTTRLELANSLVTLSSRLLAVERGIVEKELPPDKLQALRAVLEERAALEPAYRELPQLREEYESRRSRIERELGGLQERNFRLRWEIEEMRRSIAGLREFMQQNPDVLTAQDDRLVRKQIAQADDDVGALEQEQRNLENEIAKQKSLLAVSTAEQAEDQALRARYTATLEREREILSAAGVAVTGPQAQQLAEVGRLRERLVNDHAEIARFGAELDDLVGHKALELKAALLKEQSALEGYREAVGLAHEDARRVVGEIAIASLEEVEHAFKDIILRGDVGIVDVAWARKDKKTQEISKRVAEQRRELKVLDREFAEVLADDE